MALLDTHQNESCGRWLRGTVQPGAPAEGDALLARMAADLPALSPQLRKAASFLVRERGLPRHCRITDFAQLTGTTPVTVVRLAKRYGFRGYYELKFAFLAATPPAPALDTDIRPTLDTSGHTGDLVHGAARALGLLRELLQSRAFGQAAQWFEDSDEVWLQAESAADASLAACISAALKHAGFQVRLRPPGQSPRPSTRRNAKTVHLHLALHGDPAGADTAPQATMPRTLWLRSAPAGAAPMPERHDQLLLPADNTEQLLPIMIGLVTAWGSVLRRTHPAH
jgi:hypothetical protein